jgi:DNA-directed RNA polymerase specialized sigma24 family protein
MRKTLDSAHSSGLTLKEIARRLGMGERTVRYWLSRGFPYGNPELRHKRRRRGFDRYAFSYHFPVKRKT